MPPPPAEAQEQQSVRPTHSEPSTHFYIRDFEAGDTRAVHAMFAAAQEEYGNSMEYVRHAIEHDLSDATAHYVRAPRSAFFCAVDGATQQLLGIVGIRPLQVAAKEYYEECVAAYASSPAPSPSMPLVPDSTAELNRMAVAQSARRRGVARALLRHCLAFCHAQRYTHLHLTTMATLKHSVAFYSACGMTRYRTDRINFKDDPKVGTEAMRRAYEERGEREEDRSRKFIALDEVPTDDAAAADMQRRGVFVGSHFIAPIDGSAATAAHTPPAAASNA